MEENKNNQPKVVTKVSVIDTMRTLDRGQSITLKARTSGPIGTARVAACRLNSAAGRQEYNVCTDDNGTTYTITRN